MKTQNTKPLECAHGDTCLPDYWGGHHLPHIAVPVWHGMTMVSLKRSLLSELNGGAIAGSVRPDDFPDSWYRRARAAVRRLKPGRKGARRLFLDLEPDDGDGESVMAFFVFVEL